MGIHHLTSSRIMACGLSASWPLLAGAAEVPQAGAGLPGHMVQTVMGLAAIVLLIFGLAWLLRQVFRLQPTMNGRMRVLGGLSLGPRERIVLIKVGDTQLVVGTTPGRIQTLHVLDKPLPEDEAPSAPGRGPFAHQLAEALGRRKTREKGGV
ncbi:MAG: flagellar biosynthetic protein FliO [Gammaproteobacteria bacterium]|nr:flagellar biosynthetic protein FliO [Gammaproteobacteria bacterium]